MRTIGGIAVAIWICATGEVATAEEVAKPSFDELAAKAKPISRDALAGLVWSQVATCEDGDALARRQCKAVRDRRVKDLATATLMVRGDGAAFEAAAVDPKKKSVPVKVIGCIACVEPVMIDGVGYYLVSDKSMPSFTGDVGRGAVLQESSHSGKTEEAASRWRAEVVPRLRVDFVFRLGSDRPWTQGGKRGVSLELLGWRAYDPCDGDVVSATPKAVEGEQLVDKAACGEAAADASEVDKGGGGDVVKEEKIPDELTAAMIKEAMKPVRTAGDACLAKYGVTGDGKLHVTVNADGAVTAFEQTGDFADTPTGKCLEKAVRAVSFPRTKKAKQSFKYPIILR